MGIFYGSGDKTAWQVLAREFTPITGYSFLVFNLLCAPCFAAISILLLILYMLFIKKYSEAKTLK